MKDYIPEHEAIEAIMQDAKEFSPNVPPVVTLSIQILHRNLMEIHDRLGNEQHPAAQPVADCAEMVLELFGQIEGGFDLMCEKNGTVQ